MGQPTTQNNLAGSPDYGTVSTDTITKQEKSPLKWRYVQAALAVMILIAAIGLPAWSRTNGTQAMGGNTPTPQPTTTATATPPPQATSTPTPLTALMCRATADYGTIAANGLYKITGWTRARDGMVYIPELGWIPHDILPCPTSTLPEMIYYAPTATPQPTPTTTANPTPTRAVKQPTPTKIVLGITLSCNMSGYITNRLSTVVHIAAFSAPWQQDIAPGGSIWLNPNGDVNFEITATNRQQSLIQLDKTSCWGGTLQ